MGGGLAGEGACRQDCPEAGPQAPRGEKGEPAMLCGTCTRNKQMEKREGGRGKKEYNRVLCNYHADLQKGLG